MNEKHKKVCRDLKYCEDFIIFISAYFYFYFSGCVSASAFALLFGVAVGITGSAVALKNCSRIKKKEAQ